MALDGLDAVAVGEAVAHAELADSLSMAFLLVLERLNPVERAVFVLHDVFDFGYDEIAGIVGKTAPNCRQLAADARTYGDGGGKAPQWATPIVGAERIARLFLAMSKQLAAHELTLDLREVNGQPGAVVRTPAGELVNVFVLDIADGLVQAVRSVINPDKVRHLGPVADVRAMGRQAGA